MADDTPYSLKAERLSDASASTFSPRAARWLVGVGASSLLLTLVLSVLTASDSPSQQTAENNAFSVSSVGHEALVEVLETVGLEVVVSRHRSVERASRTRALMLLEPEVGDKELERLSTMVARAAKQKIPTIVALPKWRVSESVKRTGWANRLERATPFRIDELLRTLDTALETDLAAQVEVFDQVEDEVTDTVTVKEQKLALDLETVQCLGWSEALEPLVEADDCGLFARVAGTSIYLLADPEPLSTMGLGRGDHAALAVAILEDVLDVEGVVVDEVAHGFERPQTIWQELFRFPLVLVTFHLALLMALALWAATHRFGKPERPPPRVPAGKTTLIENTATLLALGHHAGTGAKKYLEAALRQLARAYGLPPELAPENRLERLALFAKRVDTDLDLHTIAREVAALQDGGGRRQQRRAKTLALKIHRLKTEMLHGDRSGS